MDYLRMTNFSQNSQKLANIFECLTCHYITSRVNDMNKHKITAKHLRMTYGLQNSQKLAQPFLCECGSIYKYRQGLSKHKKSCSVMSITNGSTTYLNQELILKLIDQNKLLTDQNSKLTEMIIDQNKQITDIIPKIGNATNNTTNINTNCNNKFNIQIFLNEQCKDAISIEKFIKSIEISLQNLLITKEKGLAEGITNIFIENMNKLPLTQRPLHCTDIKRETIYIKNEYWEKDENRDKLKNAIKRVSNKQTQNMNKFTEVKPNFMNNQQDKQDFIDIVKTATEEIEDKDDKIIKSLCKNVYINGTMIDK